VLLLLLLLQVDWDLILLMQPPTLIGAIAGELPAQHAPAGYPTSAALVTVQYMSLLH
jgi:uncharacterized membrane protein YfcA